MINVATCDFIEYKTADRKFSGFNLISAEIFKFSMESYYLNRSNCPLLLNSAASLISLIFHTILARYLRIVGSAICITLA